MDIQFWVKLIKVDKIQSKEAQHSLNVNCTHVKGQFYIFEGDEFVLEEDGCGVEGCHCHDFRLKYQGETFWKIRHDCAIKDFFEKQIKFKDGQKLRVTIEEVNDDD